MPLKIMSSEKLSEIGLEVSPRSEIRPPRRTMSKAVRFRDDYVFSEGAVSVYADDFDVLADMRFTCSALQTFTAGNVHLRGNEIAFFYAGDFVAVGHNLSAKFVPWDQRRMNAVLRPAVPLINVQVRPANGGHLHLDQHVGAAEAGNFYLSNLRSRRGFRLNDG